MLRAMREPEVLAVELARPMPQQPNYIAARGTEIHAFIETHYDRATLFDWDELEGAWDRREPTLNQCATSKAHFSRVALHA